MKFLFILSLFLIVNVFAQEGVFVDPEEPAQFPGGTLEFRKFIKENFIYPPDAIEKELTGKCYVRFKISKEGVCSDFIVKKPVPNCASCDAEALRILKLMPRWEPAKLNGEPVESVFNIPIIFRLN